MKVLPGLKNVVRGNTAATQGSRLYSGLMCHLARMNKPRWMNRINQRLKWTTS
jgi:hypothetical protein